MRRALIALGVAGSVLSAQPAAQTPARRVFVEATSESGAPVLDLRPEEFEILEGGERREIAGITAGPRPNRIVLMVDCTEGIRQPIGQIRRALASFLDNVDPQHEMMLVTVAGNFQVRVRPTLERRQMHEAVGRLFGSTGVNVMNRTIDETFHRFGRTTDARPVFVVVTGEGFESTQRINPQEIAHIADDVKKREGVLHAVRMLLPASFQVPATGGITELPVSLMVARATGGVYTAISPNGLLEVLLSVAGAINNDYVRAQQGYRVEYKDVAAKRTPVVPEVRVLREGVRVRVMAGQ